LSGSSRAGVELIRRIDDADAEEVRPEVIDGGGRANWKSPVTDLARAAR